MRGSVLILITLGSTACGSDRSAGPDGTATEPQPSPEAPAAQARRCCRENCRAEIASALGLLEALAVGGPKEWAYLRTLDASGRCSYLWTLDASGRCWCRFTARAWPGSETRPFEAPSSCWERGSAAYLSKQRRGEALELIAPPKAALPAQRRGPDAG